MQEPGYPPHASDISQQADAFLKQHTQPAPGYGVWLFLLAFYLVVITLNRGWWLLRIIVSFFEGVGTSSGPIGIKTIHQSELELPLLKPYILLAFFLNIFALRHFVRRSEITPWLLASCLGLEQLYNYFLFSRWWEYATPDDWYLRATSTALFLVVVLYLFLSKRVKRVFID